jgi:hypothetical protein
VWSGLAVEMVVSACVFGVLDLYAEIQE